ncbi:hypothetical protein D3C72_2153330 [compost metagenome]
MAHETVVQPHGRPAHRGFAEVEGRAAATDSSAHHDEPDLRPAQHLHFGLLRQAVPHTGQVMEFGACQKIHHALALGLLVFCVFQSSFHCQASKCLVI